MLINKKSYRDFKKKVKIYGKFKVFCPLKLIEFDSPSLIRYVADILKGQQNIYNASSEHISPCTHGEKKFHPILASTFFQSKLHRSFFSQPIYFTVRIFFSDDSDQ